MAPGSVTVGAFEPTDHPCAQHIQPALRTPAYHIAPDPQLCQESQKSDLRSGVLYPILARMLSAGWLTDGWEDPVTVDSGRPPRRYYQLTDRGRIELGAVVSEARKRAPLRTAIRAIRIAT